MLSMHRLLRLKPLWVPWAVTTCACVFTCVEKNREFLLTAKGKKEKTLCCVHWECTGMYSIMSCNSFPWRAVFKIHKQIKVPGWNVVQCHNWECELFGRTLPTFLLAIFLVCAEISKPYTPLGFGNLPAVAALSSALCMYIQSRVGERKRFIQGWRQLLWMK